MGEYLELQGILQASGDENTIYDIQERNNRVYFYLGGHQFQTYGSYIYHKSHPFFDHPMSDIMAEKHNDPETIEKESKRDEQTNIKHELFMKHRVALFKIIFLQAFDILNKKGEDAFIDYIDHHLFIMEEENNCDKIIKLLEND